MEGDLSLRLVEGVDAFLDRKLEEADRKPARLNYAREENREFLAEVLGVARDPIHEDTRFEYLGAEPGPVAESGEVVVHEVRWKAFRDVFGMGLLLEPKNREPLADVVAIPDAGQTPEEVVLGERNPFAFRLARGGCRVVVPMLINRENHKFPMSNREWLHRPAYELGRTLAGYETNKVVAAVRCLKKRPGLRKTLVCGWGEGARIALYAGSLPESAKLVDGLCVSGYFGSRKDVWKEPADRTVFHLLSRFGDAGIASLASGRVLIEHAPAPVYAFRPGKTDGLEIVTTERPKLNGGKPGRLLRPTLEEARAEVARVGPAKKIKLLTSATPLSRRTLQTWFADNGIRADFKEPEPPEAEVSPERIEARHAGQLREIETHNTWALTEAIRERDTYFKGLDTSGPAAFAKTIEPYRDTFRDEIIGSFEGTETYLPPNPRTRKYQTGPKTVSYEVALDVYEDVIAYGILTLPKGIDWKAGKKKLPVVVCQHGLEGRPQHVVGEEHHRAYKAFATRLAEEGFVTFAPQNLYLFRDKFRMLQFKANSIGKTLFSVMVPQHKVITDWLAGFPCVDAERIAFYGLSYGGKSAMRIPPLVERYCLSICSADFNDWIWKICATDPKSLRYTYVNKGEYEIFEFNLGRTFNYAEMAALIAPRPFMVERGHFDGVAPDETVAYEYAKVRHLYAAKLGIPGRTEIEWFVGPHSINGKGAYEFLRKHLSEE